MKTISETKGAKIQAKQAKSADQEMQDSKKSSGSKDPAMELFARSFTIRRNQYEDLLQLAAFNKILGRGASNSSEIMRDALDMYFESLGEDKYWRF
ncbi:MAG: hypothetical protein LBH87_01185 [Coriobacteriales bacterium]|jgi:hypothetical protein|nr:hypothetical protein [Coriobacteriales bacterium]